MEEIQEDWISRLFKAAETEDAEPSSSPRSAKKKTRKGKGSPKCKAKAKPKSKASANQVPYVQVDQQL